MPPRICTSQCAHACTYTYIHSYIVYIVYKHNDKLIKENHPSKSMLINKVKLKYNKQLPQSA